jgi:hypothetical protein
VGGRGGEAGSAALGGGAAAVFAERGLREVLGLGLELLEAVAALGQPLLRGGLGARGGLQDVVLGRARVQEAEGEGGRAARS